MGKEIDRVKAKGDIFMTAIKKDRECHGRLMKKREILFKLELDHNVASILWSYLEKNGFTIERFTVRCPTYQEQEQTPVSE